MLEKNFDIPLNANAEQAWHAWLQVTRARCHLHYELEGNGLRSHVGACLRNATAQMRRISSGLARPPRKILEIGCSTGFNCIALSQMFPAAEIHGIEPDGEAVSVAKSMAAAGHIGNVYFRQGVGEELPYDEREFDLIICLTVIEHVLDVELVIAEICRVLAPGGIVRLEAPNYIWPYEPHLGIWCIPLLGKTFAKLMAVLQGKGSRLSYLDHLKFVTPGKLEAAFKTCDLDWHNEVETKLRATLAGNADEVVAYKRAAAALSALARFGAADLLVRLVMWSKLYPSVLYTIRKSETL